MQYDVDFSAVPNSHWSQWRDEEFDFLCSHHVWEHPAVSKLAQKTRPSYWEFDCDADWAIHNFVYNYWVDDILARKDEVDEDLYYKALEYHHINNFDVLEHKSTLDLFVSMREADGKDYNKIYDTDDESIFSMVKDVSIEEWQKIDFEREVKDPYMYRLVQEITMLVFTTEYAPDKEHINARLKEQYKNGDEKEQRIYDLYINDERDKDWYTPITPIEYKLSHHNRVYWLMIILYPAENIPSYFHDQMVFMNYIQRIVRHQGFDEQKEIVLKNSLLSETPDVDDFSTALDEIGSYWT